MTTEAGRLTVRLMEAQDVVLLAREVRLGRDHIEARWIERQQGLRTIFVAELGGRFAGSVSFDERPELPRLLHLFALAVAPALHNRGIGSALIAHVEEEARRRGLDGVCLGVADGNAPARRLYERLGYRREGDSYVSRWLWRGLSGAQREVVETVYRMFKRFQDDGGGPSQVN
ncbi:MAG: GNAT family N-acetyltransferase [Dehalococcoidia bacterium]|nr:GNAT family N-acetyltransferase [Dehalococcoidia bacterium]